MSNEIKFWKGGNITSMTGNNIFVYGANPEFRNGFGSAKTSRLFGAKPYGSGRGIVGNTFGLITKNLKAGYIEKATGIKYELEGERSVSPSMISDNIEELYQCALNNPDKKFFVAYMNNSRNLNGYSPKEIWELFTIDKNVPLNMRFHDSFRSLLKPKNTVADVNKKEIESVLKNKEKELINNTTKTNSINVFNYDEEIKKDNQPRENFTFFWHSPSPFSQWHPSIFKVKDLTFTSAEQFMMYCKAKLFKDEKVAQDILAVNMSEHIFYDEFDIETHREDTVVKRYATGQITKKELLGDYKLRKEWDGFQKEIKDFGREVKNYNEELWVKHRIPYVAKGSFEKFTQNEDVKQELLNTDGTIMTEANPYDKIWANKLKEFDPDSTSPSKWKGLNLLGKILTTLREKLKLDLKNELELNQTNKKTSNETQQKTKRKNKI